MAQPVLPASDPQAQRRPPPSLIDDVRNAVCDFLKKQPDVREVRVRKLVQIDAETGIWEAEAEVYVPNATIKALGLPVQKEVLDCQDYLLRVDGQLNVVAYGPRDSVGEGSE
jgi:hypothetical protein